MFYTYWVEILLYTDWFKYIIEISFTCFFSYFCNVATDIFKNNIFSYF